MNFKVQMRASRSTRVTRFSNHRASTDRTTALRRRRKMRIDGGDTITHNHDPVTIAIGIKVLNAASTRMRSVHIGARRNSKINPVVVAASAIEASISKVGSHSVRVERLAGKSTSARRRRTRGRAGGRTTARAEVLSRDVASSAVGSDARPAARSGVDFDAGSTVKSADFTTASACAATEIERRSGDAFGRAAAGCRGGRGRRAARAAHVVAMDPAFTAVGHADFFSRRPKSQFG
jgi:hypothetical protein